MRVLFVDDNAMNRLVVKNMLAAADVEMEEAENAEFGLAKIDAEHFDLVLMDFRMPGMDGLGAIVAIRARSDAKALLPIIMVTADDGPDLHRKATAAGADGLLRKPVEMQQLFDTIGKAVTQAGGSDQTLT